ncbi:MAG: YciI family protein [Negativicutes bacterium]|nr:YciI family protein [Negativicutes bacterium]
MIIIMGKYLKPLEEIDALLVDHRKWLDDGLKAEKFICAGARDPRIGGIIVADLSLDEAREIVKKDPFYINEAVEYEFFKFLPGKFDPRFSCFVNK